MGTKWVFIWKWELVVLSELAGGSKIVSVYMVHLQGMSHQFEINLTLHLIITFEISLLNFLNVLGFLLLASEKTEFLRF